MTDSDHGLPDTANATGTATATAITQAAQTLGRAARVVVFTGAGMSADSGIATFRDALTGLWACFDAETLATVQGFEADPSLVWGWYAARRQKVLLARPNAGHLAVAHWLRHRPGWQVVTQNVDDLHERAAQAAGADPAATVHLHGSLFAPRCHHCGQPHVLAHVVPDGVAHAMWHDLPHDRQQTQPQTQPQPQPPTLRHTLPPGLPGESDAGQRLPPPRCTACGGPVRPGVVWFGEALPHTAWARAEAAVRGCDAMLVVGTSGVVHPAAGLPKLALALGKPVWVVNPDADGTGSHPLLHHLRGRAATLLPALAAAMA